jgi:Na+/melibiose symporter-like transporter
MSSHELIIDSEQLKIEDANRLKRIKIITPVYSLIYALSATFEGYYLTYFLTDIYKFPVAFTGILSVVSVVLTWVFAPVFGAFSDKFKFKNSKYWPWMFIGFTLVHAGLILVMALPSFGIENAAVLAPLAFAIILVVRLSEQVANVPTSGMAPNLTKSPSDRQYLAQARKLGMEAGKSVWGYLAPMTLGAITSLVGGNTNNGFALTALVLFAVGWTGPTIYAVFGIRGSYVEREALKQTEKIKQEKVPLSQTLKVLFTNRPVLGIFIFYMLHKLYFFIYVIYGISVYDHIFGQADAVGPFFTIFSVASVIGVLGGRLWTKLYKESKRSCAMAMAAQIIATALIAFTFNKVPIPVFLVFFAILSFFMGMLENWVMPLYTACAEYGNWKTGIAMNALVMSTFGLSISASYALPPVIASFLLRPESYNQGLTILFAWVPLVLAVVSFLSITFIFNLNDTKIKKIQDDLSAGKTQATSELEI